MYPQHHVIYAPVVFEVATSNFKRKCIEQKKRYLTLILGSRSPMQDHREHAHGVLGYILCDLDPKINVTQSDLGIKVTYAGS